MNITFFIGSIYGGGSERVVCNMASYMVEKGHNIRILAMAETPKQYELNEKVEVSYLLGLSERKGWLKNNLKRLIRLEQYMKNNKQVDLYIVMLPVTSILLLVFRQFTKAKIIVSERCAPTKYTIFIQKMYKVLAKRADGYVFQTKEARNWYEPYIKGVLTEIIPNAINTSFIKPIYEGERKKEIVSVGRLEKQKNFELLVDSFIDISHDFPEYKVVIYGEGSRRESLEKRVKELDLQDRIIFPGNVTDVASRIQKSSVFVLSSDFEGMPNALMEAMALGLPCIATDCPVGGPRYLIENGVNGILIPHNDKEAMVNALRQMLTDETKATSMGKKASTISERFSSNNIYAQWESFCIKVVKKHI
jgi:glycosyltransferase involved in cell wall biosynthesis